MNSTESSMGMPPVGENLKKQRTARHLSLGELAKASGISKAMLSQIEGGKVNPTLVILWKAAQALGIDVSELISPERQKPAYFHKLTVSQQAAIASESGTLFKILSAPELPEGLEMYHVFLPPGAVHSSEPHAAGCKEFVMVLKGTVKISNGVNSAELDAGDFLAYDGAMAHSVENTGKKPAELHMIDFS